MKSRIVFTTAWLLTLVVAFEFGRRARNPTAHFGRSELSSDVTGPTTSSHPKTKVPPTAEQSNSSVADVYADKGSNDGLFLFSKSVEIADSTTIKRQLAELAKFPASSRRSEMAALLYRRWGSIAPGEALEAIADLPIRQRDVHEVEILAGWVSANPDDALSWVRQQDPAATSPRGMQLYRSYVDSLLERDQFDLAARQISALPSADLAKQIMAAKLAEAWAAYDPSAAGTWIYSLSGIERLPALNAASKALFGSDPDLALAFALSNSDPGARSAVLANTIRSWVSEGNPKQAEAWLLKQPASPELDNALDSYVRFTAMKDPFAAAEVADHVTSREQKEKIIDRTISVLKTSSPEAAVAWTIKYLEDTKRFDAYRDVMTIWSAKDPAAAAANISAQHWLTDTQKEAVIANLNSVR